MKRTNKTLVSFLCVISLLCTAFPFISHATSTQEKLNQAKQEQAELNQKLDEQQEDLEGLQSEKSSLQKELQGLNNNLEDIGNSIEKLEKDIAEKEAHIEETRQQLEEAKATEQAQYEAMKKRIQFIYESGDTLYMEMFLGARSFADFVNLNEYVEMISEYDRNMLLKYREEKERIAALEQDFLREKTELDELKVAAEVEKSRVMAMISQVSHNIDGYQDQISEVEKIIDDYEAQQDALAQDIEALQKQLEEELRLSQKAAGSTWRSIEDVAFAEGDRYLLANLIYCEAGGEPYEGQVAVGAVVINRVLSSVFPDTVTGVIYQNRQFSPVASGRLALALAQNRATESCYRAADEAMSGYTNVGNCVFFRTPIPGLEGIVIGGHVFY